MPPEWEALLCSSGITPAEANANKQELLSVLQFESDRKQADADIIDVTKHSKSLSDPLKPPPEFRVPELSVNNSFFLLNAIEELVRQEEEKPTFSDLRPVGHTLIPFLTFVTC